MGHTVFPNNLNQEIMEEREIDERFKNQQDLDAFKHCLVCQKELIESNSAYFIERIFRRVDKLDVNEAIFEYAMCEPCAHALRKDLSKESLENIENYFTQNLNRHGAQAARFGTEKCLMTGAPISNAKEYSIHAHCKGSKMIHSIFPYAISDAAMDEMSELLSNETLDILDNFKGKYFTGPPEVAELLNPKRLLPL